MTASTKADLNQVTPSRRRVIDPALSELALTSLSDLNRLVRTRMLGGVGAGEGDLPGYPIRRPSSLRLATSVSTPLPFSAPAGVSFVYGLNL